MATYQDKLKDPRWQKKRLEALEFYNWRCVECKDDKRTLHVHHSEYQKGLDPWDYDILELSVLCEECHYLEHNRDKAHKMLIDAIEGAGFISAREIVRLAELIRDEPFWYGCISELEKIVNLYREEEREHLSCCNSSNFHLETQYEI